MRALARRLGMDYLGDAVPNSLTLEGTSLANVSTIWHVLDGMNNGVRIVAFDCRVGKGKSSWSQTVVAAQTEADSREALRFNPGFSLERSGPWQLFFEPLGSYSGSPSLIPVEELGAHIENLASAAKS